MPTFLLIWFGQLISLTGSGLTGFALGVWVYQRTGSVTSFALISFATALPGILMTPFAGALVDRWDRRTALLVSDTGAGVCTLLMAALLAAERLELWQIYLLTALSAVFNAFQWPAYSAAVSLLVPQAQLGRANGLIQLGAAVGQIAAPVLAAALVLQLGVAGVLFIDVASFFFAVGTLLLVRIPRPAPSEAGRQTRGSLAREAAFGWRYIIARPGLVGLLVMFALTNFTSTMVSVLFMPLVLTFASSAALGSLLSVGGLGMLVGSLGMSAWGGTRPRVIGLLVCVAIEGLVLMLAGLPPSRLLLGAAAFIYFLTFPVVNASSQAIWQSKVPADLQGRVFAVRRVIAWSSLPLAYLLAGPLADRVFEPLLAVGGPLAGSVGQVLGTGPGRGIALIFIVLGGLAVAAAAAAWLNPHVRRVEADLPDARVDTAAALA